MGVTLLTQMAFGLVPCNAIVSPGANGKRVSDLCMARRLVCYKTASKRKKKVSCKDWVISRSTSRIFASMDDSNDTATDLVDGAYSSGGSEVLGTEEDDELIKARKALSEARAKQEAIGKERDLLIEELARSKAKQKEYIDTILHDKELAISELEAAKSLFHQKLQESVEEKFSLESKLVLAKQDAVELAVRVEKLAEIAFQQATSHILEDAQLRVSAAETSAAEAAYQIEKQIKDATEGTISSIVEQSKDAIEKALDVAEKAGDYATKAVSAFGDGINPIDEIVTLQSEIMKLNGVVNDLESQLLLRRSEVDKLKFELEQVCEQASAFEIRANDAEKALAEFQEASRKKALEQEEGIKSLMEKMKKDALERKKAATEAFKAELESVKAAIEAAKETASTRDTAYLRRCEALQRSLTASEDALNMWRQRANLAESLLVKESPLAEADKDSIYVVNGGRIDLLTGDDDSRKWKLLSNGPRREIPQWRARRIRTIRPKFPPRKIDAAEALTSKFKTLDLPKPDEVWSIAEEKLKEGDTLIEQVIEKETIEKKRKALERAL